ncbi:MAG TPA: flagella basal body P-ring formation protein FlgA [Capsulimonadaceae bacterium]|jgi:hypothetical protein
MKHAFSTIFLTVPAIAMAAPAPAPIVVTLKPSASVNAESFTLADIAEIKAPATAVAALGAATIGRTPLEGASRTITKGDVCLKLRQAGFDPSTIRFVGTETLTITKAPVEAVQTAPSGNQVATTTAGTVLKTSATGTISTSAASNAAIVPVKPLVTKAGDPVCVQYVDGPVFLTVQGVLVTSAGVGDTVTVRTNFSQRMLRGTLVDSQTVRL